MQRDEGLVALWRELNITKNGAGDIGSDLHSIRVHGDLMYLAISGRYDTVFGDRGLAAEDVEHEGDAFDT